jgi:5-formyltetrahydrofolate cyclo-ligase
MLASLRAISPEEALSAGRRICRGLTSWPGFARASQVVAFSTLPGEIDTRPLWEAVRAAGKVALLPRIVEGDLEFVPHESEEEWVRGRFGVLEPGPRSEAASLAQDAIVLVPGLAFDRLGGRLGRGAGYYDRALTKVRRTRTRVTLIGVAFSLQIIDRVPMTRDDVGLDGLLTEEGLTWVSVGDPGANGDVGPGRSGFET